MCSIQIDDGYIDLLLLLNINLERNQLTLSKRLVFLEM